MLAAASIGVVVAVTASGQFAERADVRFGTFDATASGIEITVEDSKPSDWISLIGPAEPIDVLGARATPTTSGPRASAGSTTRIEGTGTSILGQITESLEMSWLGGFTERDGVFAGPVSGSGQWMAVWYLSENRVWGGLVQRGSRGRFLLTRNVVAPERKPSRPVAPASAGLGFLAFLSIIAVAKLSARPDATTRSDVRR